MNTLVMKFGGSSVRTPESFIQIAEIISKRALAYKKIVVVVSAMSQMTDELFSLANQIHPSPPKREQDMLVSVGERISISLLAMALNKIDRDAISFTGSQSGIITCARHSEAKIIDVRPFRLLPHLDAGKIVIVAGFQGVGLNGEITTLGRGGSDTSAVALAVALQAKVEFYKDVVGIFSEDPKINPNALLYKKINYKEALMVTQKGKAVIHPRAIELAAKNGILLQLLSYQDFTSNEEVEKLGTMIGELSNNSSFCYEPDELSLSGEAL